MTPRTLFQRARGVWWRASLVFLALLVGFWPQEGWSLWTIPRILSLSILQGLVAAAICYLSVLGHLVEEWAEEAKGEEEEDGPE